MVARAIGSEDVGERVIDAVYFNYANISISWGISHRQWPLVERELAVQSESSIEVGDLTQADCLQCLQLVLLVYTMTSFGCSIPVTSTGAE